MDKSVRMADQTQENLALNEACLVVNLKNLSHIKSWFAKEHPNYCEGNYINREEVDKKELKMGFGRAKRIVANINIQLSNINEIFRFQFPRLSYICFIVKFFHSF